jgi:DNA-binding NarL/FixJ family response regulator
MKQESSPSHGITDQQVSGATVPDSSRESLRGYPQENRITVVDDDPGVCEMIEKLLAGWNFITSVPTAPFSLSKLYEIGVSTDIFLMNISLPTGTTMNWIPIIMDNFPEAKVIVMSDYAGTDTAIQAIQNGAFDFLHKPIESELLKHSLHRVIQLQEKDRHLKQILADQRHNDALMVEQKQRLEFLTARMIENNRAFSTLAQNLDFERAEILNRITQNIQSGVIQTLAKIRSDIRTAQYAIEMDMVINKLQDLTSETNGSACPLFANLTTMEARVASLIKIGMNSEKIAERLFISMDTVKTHRKNIRKKLKLTNSQTDLREYLLNLPAPDPTPLHEFTLLVADDEPMWGKIRHGAEYPGSWRPAQGDFVPASMNFNQLNNNLNNTSEIS